MEKDLRRNIDLSALRTLKLVRELGSISMAARRLDLDQSAVSHTLNRLRRLFEDPLFVRTKNGIAATDRCEQIVLHIDAMLEGFDRLTRPQHFDPGHDDSHVVIGVGHANVAVMMPQLVRLLRREAPRMRLRFIQSRTSAYDALEAGSCDILIRLMPQEDLPFRRRLLLRERMVCLVDRDGPYGEHGLTLEQYAAARHILVSFESTFRPPWFDRMEAMDKPLHVVLDLATTSEIEKFIVGTDLIATIPEELSRLCSDRVAIVPAPINAHQDICMFWTDRTHEVASLAWLRDRIVEIAAGLECGARIAGSEGRLHG